jgi:hypothetical protein
MVKDMLHGETMQRMYPVSEYDGSFLKALSIDFNDLYLFKISYGIH